ncbi:MAG: YciI family protein [Gammaproteobacteria bacterium]
MKYLCLVYLDEKRLAELPDEECVAYDISIRDGGHCIASEALESVQTATTVRIRNGKVSVTDGPFAETKEQLAGFYMIEAKDLNEAIQLASKIPPARVGSIEVRPIRPIRETVQAQPQAGNARRSG